MMFAAVLQRRVGDLLVRRIDDGEPALEVQSEVRGPAEPDSEASIPKHRRLVSPTLASRRRRPTYA